MKALQIAATGMSAQQTRVDVISNNLANMSTTGYNARRAEFADLSGGHCTRDFRSDTGRFWRIRRRGRVRRAPGIP